VRHNLYKVRNVKTQLCDLKRQLTYVCLIEESKNVRDEKLARLDIKEFIASLTYIQSHLLLPSIAEIIYNLDTHCRIDTLR